jgi:hypothetical protein
MREPFDDEVLTEARRYIDRAFGGIDALHIGPLDYNISTTADYLRTAASLIEEFGRKQAAGECR